MHKAHSESSLSNDDTLSTPPNFNPRLKRKREDEDMDYESFKTEMKTMMEEMLAKHANELDKKITPTLKQIQETNTNIQASINFLTEQNTDLKKQIEELKLKSKKDFEYIASLEEKLENMQRESRKTSIEIKNVPKGQRETKEELINMVTNLAKNIDCQIEKPDIKDIYRVQGKKAESSSSPIIVEMSSTIIKTEILQKSKVFNRKHQEKLRAKHLGNTGSETPIFISEQLTAKNARLYYLARELARSKSYKFCWTSYGKVYVRKDENSPIILIKSETQVQKLIQGT
ncbi:hypothetical protein NE865_08787 [Phthorimaea operculella]|nr:hypothetical protein NE865_08787 [Phthorimaea operculella]